MNDDEQAAASGTIPGRTVHDCGSTPRKKGVTSPVSIGSIAIPAGHGPQAILFFAATGRLFARSRLYFLHHSSS